MLCCVLGPGWLPGKMLLGRLAVGGAAGCRFLCLCWFAFAVTQMDTSFCKFSLFLGCSTQRVNAFNPECFLCSVCMVFLLFLHARVSVENLLSSCLGCWFLPLSVDSSNCAVVQSNSPSCCWPWLLVNHGWKGKTPPQVLLHLAHQN